jgi:hypothetical protein
VLLSNRKNLIALMANRVTKPLGPRGSERANVETMGGQALPENAAARLSDIRLERSKSNITGPLAAL